MISKRMVDAATRPFSNLKESLAVNEYRLDALALMLSGGRCQSAAELDPQDGEAIPEARLLGAIYQDIKSLQKLAVQVGLCTKHDLQLESMKLQGLPH